jgi:hypothetical protein
MCHIRRAKQGITGSNVFVFSITDVLFRLWIQQSLTLYFRISAFRRSNSSLTALLDAFFALL